MLQFGVLELQHPSSIHQKYSIRGGILKDGGFLTAALKNPRASTMGAAISCDSDEARALLWAADCGSQQGGTAAKVVGEKAKRETIDPIGFDTVQRTWTIVGRNKWNRRESIPVLEGRAVVHGVKHLLRNVGNFNKKHLILSDSLTAVCALDKGRGRAFKMRRVTQQVGALCLVANVGMHYHWLPSEWNPADAPSRGSLIASLHSRHAMVFHKFVPLPRTQKSTSVKKQCKKQSTAPLKGTVKSAAEKKLERAALMEEFGTLSMASVSPRCRATYMECLARMARSTGINLDGQNTAAEVDKALCLMLDQMFLEGEDLSKAQYMMAAVLFKWPQFQFPKQMLLPVSTQSLQGWRKLEPPRSRLPLRWEAVCLMAEHMMGHDMVEEALMMLLAFVMYLRPGEVCKLRCQDLVPPVGQGRREASKWSLVLHPQEELVPSKTAEFEETLLFDLPYTKFVAISVHQWRRTSSRPGHQLIFSKTASQLREAMVSVAQKYALQPLGDPHPYRSRHGGASRDFATGDRKQPDNTTPGSLEDSRINKEVREGGRLGQLMRSLSQKVRDAAYKAAARIEKTAQCRR